jgi:DNA mismatch endonuclease (patch repair protein)
MSLPEAPPATSPAIRRVMQGNRKRDTRPELRVGSHLHACGLRYRRDLAVVAGAVRVRPDFVFTRSRVAVFVDGCFWHGCPDHGTTPKANSHYWGPKLARNQERDRLVNAALQHAGWAVVRIWEHEAPDRAAEAVRAVVAARRL